jgi:drug/metabolite transporter (DMT)-like permease
MSCCSTKSTYVLLCSAVQQGVPTCCCVLCCCVLLLCAAVAYVQMLKAFTPVVTMLFAFLFGLERPSLLLVSAVGLITAGVAVASWGEGAFSVTGVTAMVGSLICEALRLVLMQSLVSKRDMHPVQILAHIAPAATAWMLLIAGLTEALAIHQAQALHDILRHPGALVASAAAGFGANAMAMLVISFSGALTLKCLGLAKDVGLVLFGVLVLGEVVSGTQGLGYGISLLGFLLYNAARMWTGSQLAAHQTQQGSSDGSWGSKEKHSSINRSSSSRNGGSKQGNVQQPAAGAKGVVSGPTGTQLRTPKVQPAAAVAAASPTAASAAAAPVPAASAALLTSPSWVAVGSK